jgi:flagella basal body P-ring formation protein FlgA
MAYTHMKHLQPWTTGLLHIALTALTAGFGAASFAAAPMPNPAPTPASAPAAPAGVESVIEKYLQAQTTGLPGKVSVKLLPLRSGAIPPCDALQPFLPAGAALRGRVSVGVRCNGDKPWTRYVPAEVAIEGTYFVTTRAIDAGQTLGAGDYAERTGDLSHLPRTVVTDAAELAGVVAVNRVASGAPLRKDAVRGVIVIQQGQTVQLVAQGQGFTISTEGKAMTQAAVGAVVRAKTQDGRLLSGVADEDGQIKLAQ